MTLKPAPRMFAVLLGCCLQLPAIAHAQNLVAPDRIGRIDAPKSFSFRVLTVHSNNNAQPQFAAGMASLYEKYAHNHPDWRVNIQLMSLQIPQEHARLLEQARSGTAPDCSAVDSFEVPLFIRAGVLKPIDQYFSREEIDDLFPFVRPIISDAAGHIYAWWWTTDLRLLYRNTTLVPDPPRTWQETKQAALAARRTADSGLEGLVFNGGRNETTTVDFLPQFWAQGGKLVDAKGAAVFGAEPNRTYLLKAISFYRDLIQSGASPARVASISNYDDLTAAVIAGSAAMMINGDWAMGQMQTAMKPDAFAKWAISMLPGPTADQRSTASGGWTFVSFSKDPEKVKACMDLVREVYMGPATELLHRLPTRQSEFDSPSYRSAFYLQIKQYLKLGQARPGLPIYTEISNRLQIAISEALSGTRTPEAAVDEAVDQVAKAAARYQ
jgi:multiple sugar transport system substrate-binding protein